MIQQFIQERGSHYFKIFKEEDVKNFVNESNNYITLHNTFHSSFEKMQRRRRRFDKQILFKNRCARVCLGIATELMVKATYLKQGYMINRHNKPNTPNIVRIGTIDDQYIIMKTHDFSFLIKKLDSILPEHEYNFEQDIRKGLELARIWRNTNTHGVIGRHIQVGNDYYLINNSIAIINNLVLKGTRIL